MSIVVRLMGGMGNQLFQYSFGRRIALQNNSPLLLDQSFLLKRGENMGHAVRDYELDVFKIHADIAAPRLVWSIRRAIDRPFWNRLYHHFPSLFAYRIFREKSVCYDESITSLKGQFYLEGYWQSEKYFSSMEKDLRKDLQFTSPAEGRNAELLSKIRSENAVSMHVRRGDMVHVKEAADFHGVCPPEYYDAALNILRKQFADLQLYIFSDDPAWVSSNLKFTEPTTLVDWNQGKSSFEDLRLMSACKHHIIANSSFSWWGAWLNPSLAKMVIAPKAWFRDPAINTSDLIPSTWTRI